MPTFNIFQKVSFKTKVYNVNMQKCPLTNCSFKRGLHASPSHSLFILINSGLDSDAAKLHVITVTQLFYISSDCSLLSPVLTQSGKQLFNVEGPSVAEFHPQPTVQMTLWLAGGAWSRCSNFKD